MDRLVEDREEETVAEKCSKDIVHCPHAVDSLGSRAALVPPC